MKFIMGTRSGRISELFGKVIFIALSVYLLIKIIDSFMKFDYEGWKWHLFLS